ncbi:MAG: hypothetical protein EP340_05515 [Alphaproteobacteria bacterium]|nr:MAG: hypothetical protein EP340_05515 [Alphaproteobacteria bacterium]
MSQEKFPSKTRGRISSGAALALFLIVLVAPQGAKARTAKTPAEDEAMVALEHVLVSTEYREFIADQYENAEDMFAGHRGCTDYRLVARIGTEIRQPPQINPATGKLMGVDLFDKWETERCGQKLQQNFALWIVDRETLSETYASEEEVAAIAMADLAANFADENSITLVDFTIPGSTLATDEMVANIIARVLDDAEASHFKDCPEELLIVDTKFAEEVQKIRRSETGTITKGKWGEYWTVYGCGREVQYPVIITKDKDGFGIDVFTSDAHQRDF